MPLLDSSRLEALLESAHVLHGSLDLDQLLGHLLRTVMGRLLATRACAAVADGPVMRVALARGAGRLHAGDVLDDDAARANGLERLMPIGDTADPVGLLGVGSVPEARFEQERHFIDALLAMAASGVANARAHARAALLATELGQKVQELRALLDLVRGFAATQEPEDVAQLLALTFAGRWALSRYCVAAWKDGHAPVVRQRGMSLGDPLQLAASLRGAPDVVTLDTAPDPGVATLLRAERVEVLLPIRSTAVAGFVALGPRAGRLGYDEAGQEFSAALVGQAAVAFENAWHFRETLAKKKVEQELALAASIQQGLFPGALPRLVGYELAAYNRPASLVGGDYYDALPTPAEGQPRSCLLCVADVAGKGLPASLLMSTIQATLRALQGQAPSLAQLALRTSDLLFATTPGNKYATAVLVQVDADTGTGSYVNAGHTPCLMLRDNGSVDVLLACGPPMGLLPGLGYDEKPLRFAAGDTLALFSDGVTETWNSREEEFGEDRLVEVLRASRGGPAHVLVSRIIGALDEFAAGAPQHDDITLLVIKRLP